MIVHWGDLHIERGRCEGLEYVSGTMEIVRCEVGYIHPRNGHLGVVIADKTPALRKNGPNLERSVNGLMSS